MKKILFIAGLLSLFAGVANAAEVGVSISVGQPGFYGEIDLGNAPRPDLIYPRPLIVAPGPAREAPIYLRVPPGQERRWKKYCGRYNACDRPVYFVRDRWYRNIYVPHYRRHYEEYHRREHDGRMEREKRGYPERGGMRGR